ncbi:MAG: hypothetical protein GTO63_03955 [Anaerolineae bacterium]|nr:hypothetical protein [Anaerolineae bacterium]NIN94167.1 hypothetical protein [Anaerolineae bacterium]NIQ77209.1 hypothetical protein [Anaerolineae bacterium]
MPAQGDCACNEVTQKLGDPSICMLGFESGLIDAVEKGMGHVGGDPHHVGFIVDLDVGRRSGEHAHLLNYVGLDGLLDRSWREALENRADLPDLLPQM